MVYYALVYQRVISDEWCCIQTFADWYTHNSYYIPDDDKLTVHRLNLNIDILSSEHCILIPYKLALTLNRIFAYYTKECTPKKSEYNKIYKKLFDKICSYKDILPEDIYHKLIINIRF